MKVGLFVTCLVDLVRPNIGFAALKLLEDAGCEVVVPESQTCCGQPGYNSGDRETSKAMALKVLAEFRDCDYVVAPSGSCSGQVKVHFVEDLFRDAPEHAEFAALAARWFELSDFLVNVLKVDKVPGKFAGTVTYHDSCAGLRELGVKMQPRYLLQMAGAGIAEMAGLREMLRLRRHLLGEARRDFHAHGREQVRQHPRQRCGRHCRRRPRLPAQHRRAPSPHRRYRHSRFAFRGSDCRKSG